MSDPKDSIVIAADANAAYIYLTDGAKPFGRTVEHSDLILLDEDAEGNLIGVELLSLDVKVPVEDLRVKYRLDDEEVSVLNAYSTKL